MKTHLAITYGVLLTVLCSAPHAESLRCGTKLIHIGETKAEVVERCGEPIATDSYCEPIALTNTQGVQIGDNSIQNNIAINSCTDIDIWTYKPGSGKFITTLYFSQGHLQAIRYGSRDK